MNLSSLKLPSFKLPAMRLPTRKPTAGTGLVIRHSAVEVLTMQGGKLAKQVRVPFEGTGDMALLSAIERALAAAECTTKRLAVSLASQDVLVRYFTMPAIPKSEWESAAQFEVRKYIPFKTDSLVWDCAVMPGQGRGSGGPDDRLEVVFAAIPRESFAQLLSVLATAGIQPTVVEPLSASLAQLVPAGQKLAKNEFVCLVDVESDQAHLAIVKDGIPFLTRDVNLALGQEDVAEGAAGDHRAQRMLSELSVSIDFFRREYPGASITKIVLFGDEGAIGTWPQQFGTTLPCAVELGGATLSQQMPGGVPLMFAAAVGLLQRRHGRGSVGLDFLKRMRPAAASSAAPKITAASLSLEPAVLKALLMTPQVMGTAAACIGLLAAVWLLGSHQIASAQRHLDQLVRSNESVGWGLDGKTQEEVTALQASAQEELTFLKQAIDQRTPLAAKLDGLARSLPDGVWLTDLVFEDRLEATGQNQSRLTVRGACYLGGSGEEIAAIQDFQERIKRNPSLFRGFSAARLDQIDAKTDQDQYTYRTFQLQCQPPQRM